MERGHDMTYICYDNGGYMNTGMQRSSATPVFANTTTTPVGKEENGKLEKRKDLTKIMVAHNLPYVAQTAAVGTFKDLYIKSEKAIYNIAKAVGGRMVKVKAEYEIAEENGSELQEPDESIERYDHEALDRLFKKLVGL